MEIQEFHTSGIDLTISPDLLSAELGEAVELTCTITNQRILPFRMRKNWDFTLEGHVFGTLKCDVLLEGKVYRERLSPNAETPHKRWTTDEIVILKQGESHTFLANLTDTYPLSQKGTYTLQATFHPEKLKGVMVSKCRPVLSNLITIVVW
jgi:hypothetical protein